MPAAFLAALDESSDAARFLKWLGADGMDGFVAEQDGRVVGFTLLRSARDEDCPPDVGEIPTFYVAPDFWRQGVGRALCTMTLDCARDRAMSAVCLWVIDGNDRARRFYEAVGFNADGREKVDTELVGAPLREVRYRHELGDRTRHAEQGR